MFMRAFRPYVGRAVLVRCEDVTYRGHLLSVRGQALTLTETLALDQDSKQPVDGRLIIPIAHVLQVQVPG